MQAKVDLTEYRDRGQKYLHFVGLATPGFLSLSHDMQLAIIRAFMKAPKGDWFYSVECEGQKVFIAENGERGFTAMLPEEY